MNWLTVLALQTLRLVAVPGTGLLIFNDFMSLLTLLVLAGFAWTLTCFTLLAALHWNKHDPLTSDLKGWQTLDNGGKLCSFNKKETVVWTFYLVISLYDVLLFNEERLIWLCCEVTVNVINLTSLTLSFLMRCSKSL